MTIDEAIKILHPDTSRDALWKYEDSLSACNEACLLACETLTKQRADWVGSDDTCGFWEPKADVKGGKCDE